MATTTERPILFSGPMVQAILAGTKTQTRRIVAPSNSEFGSAARDYWGHCDLNAESCFADNGYLHVPCHCQDDDSFPVANRVDCKHCKEFGWEGTRHRLYPKWDEGDRLWVRETWRPCNDNDLGTCIEFRADGAKVKPEFPSEEAGWKCEQDACAIDAAKWHPSIFMPRWACRLALELTAVRVERVQDIGKDGRKAIDVLAEGITQQAIDLQRKWFHPDDSPALAFSHLWDKVNGKGAWERNDWVWALTFKRLEAPRV